MALSQAEGYLEQRESFGTQSGTVLSQGAISGTALSQAERYLEQCGVELSVIRNSAET